LKKLVSFIFVLCLVLSVSVFFVIKQLNTKNSGSSEEIVYEVLAGNSFTATAKNLERDGLIPNATFLSIYARITGGAGRMKVGEYLLNKNMSPIEVYRVLISGKSISRTFTVSEGLNVFEIAELFEKQGFGVKNEFVKWCFEKSFIATLFGETVDPEQLKKIYSLEGYLFPETYSLTKYTDTKTLIKNMVELFLKNYQSVEIPDIYKSWTRHQIVTLASIIEKETGAEEERPIISSVFHNRLRKDMMLQTDPTVIYGKTMLTGKTVINITREDLRTKTKYNTYTIKGLPPGPIANPGLAAMKAAVNPNSTTFLYFVSHNDGTHAFSQDYEAHQRAVGMYQLNRKARAGKSWRDLKQKKPSSVEKNSRDN
jgi:UPF0755 protein